MYLPPPTNPQSRTTNLTAPTTGPIRLVIVMTKVTTKEEEDTAMTGGRLDTVTVIKIAREMNIAAEIVDMVQIAVTAIEVAVADGTTTVAEKITGATVEEAVTTNLLETSTATVDTEAVAAEVGGRNVTTATVIAGGAVTGMMITVAATGIRSRETGTRETGMHMRARVGRDTTPAVGTDTRAKAETDTTVVEVGKRAETIWTPVGTSTGSRYGTQTTPRWFRPRCSASGGIWSPWV